MHSSEHSKPLPKLPSLISVSGLTGAGKSTLVKALAATIGYEALVEDVSTNPYLAQFFTDPKRYAFPLQMWFLQYRYHEYQRVFRLIQEGELRGCIFDRTLWDGLAFVRALTQIGRLEPIEAQTYFQVFTIASQNIAPPSLQLFLQCGVDVAHARIAKRGTTREENSLTLDYLEILRLEYMRLVQEWEQKKIHVVSFNAENYVDAQQVIQRLSHHYSQVLSGSPA